LTPVTELGYPVGVYVDRDFILYVADSYNHRVIAFPPGVMSGTVVAGGNGPGDNDDQLYYPHRVAGDRESNLYVADGGNHRIVRYRSGKQPLEENEAVTNIFQELNQTGRKGKVVVDKTNGNIEQKTLEHMFGVEAAAAYDTDQSIYIIDRLTRSVKQFDADTDYAKVSFSYAYETEKGFLPTAVFFVSDVLGRTTGDPTHFLYVVDISNHQVVRFEKNEFTTDVDPVIVAAGLYGRGASDEQLSSPTDTWVDDFGNLFVCDTFNSRIQLWMRGMTTGLTVAGGATRQDSLFNIAPGPDPLSLYQPSSVSVEGSDVWIVDQGNNRIVRWKYECTWESRAEKIFPTHLPDITGFDNWLIDDFDEAKTLCARLRTLCDGLTLSNGRYLLGVGTPSGAPSKKDGVDDLSANGKRVYEPTCEIVVDMWGSTSDGFLSMSKVAFYPLDVGLVQPRPDGMGSEKTITLFSLDAETREVTAFDHNSETGSTTRAFPFGKGEIFYGAAVSVDRFGRVFAADYDLHRAQRFEQGFYPLVTAAGYGLGNTSQQLAFPSGCWADDMGNVIIADTYNHRVVLWDEGAFDGLVLVGGGGAPSEVDLFFPYDVTVDFAGRMYVADSHHHRIVRWDLAHGLPDDGLCPGDRCISCTIGNLCSLSFDPGILVTEDAAVMILNTGECGDIDSEPMAFFSRDNGTDIPTYNNPQRVNSEGGEYRTFSMGNAFVAPPRVKYDLCWSRNYTKWSQRHKDQPGYADFQFRLGAFMMEGPIAGDFDCTLGESCTIKLNGSDLPGSFIDQNSLYFLDKKEGMTCGETFPNRDLFNGLANPRDGPTDTTYRTFYMGTATAGLPGFDYEVCWQRQPNGAHIIIGNLVMAGPLQDQDQYCTLSVPCSVMTEGSLLAPSSRLVFLRITSGGKKLNCGQTNTQSLAVTWGDNMKDVHSVEGPENRLFDIGVPQRGSPGDFQMCWSHLSEAFAVTLGTFVMNGPDPKFDKEYFDCTMGEPCVVDLTGVNLQRQNRIRLVPIQDGVECWFGNDTAFIEGLISESEVDEGNSTYVLGTAFVPKPMEYQLCWSHDPIVGGSSGPPPHHSSPPMAPPPLAPGTPAPPLSGNETAMPTAFPTAFPTAMPTASPTASPTLASMQIHDRKSYSFVGKFRVTRPALAGINCTLGIPCRPYIVGANNNMSNAIVILEKGDCRDGYDGRPERMVAATYEGLEIPKRVEPDENEQYYQYDLGTTRIRKNGPEYKVCWAFKPDDLEPDNLYQYWSTVGRFQMHGPDKRNTACTLGMTCTITLTSDTDGLYNKNEVLLIKDSRECGDANAIMQDFGGLLNNNDVDASEVGTQWKFQPLVRKRQVNSMSRMIIATSGEVGFNTRMCWAHDASFELGIDPNGLSQWIFEVGIFTMNGPTSTSVYCLTGSVCEHVLLGVGFQSTNKIRFTTNDARCGSYSSQTMDIPGLGAVLNASCAGEPKDWKEDCIYNRYTLGNTTSRVETPYKVCWGHDPVSPSGFNVEVGVFRITAFNESDSSCILGLECYVTINGLGFQESNSIAFVDTDKFQCGDRDLTFEQIPGLTIPLNRSTGDLKSRVYLMGVAMKRDREVPYHLCWAFDPILNITASGEPVDSYGFFSQRIGAFVLDGPNMQDFMCKFGRTCNLYLNGTALVSTNRLGLYLTKGAMAAPEDCEGNSEKKVKKAAGVKKAVLPGLDSEYSAPLESYEGSFHFNHYSLGVSATGSVPGLYTICWGYKPEDTSNMRVAIGNLLIAGIHTTNLAVTTYKMEVVRFSAVAPSATNEMWAVFANGTDPCNGQGKKIPFELHGVFDDALEYKLLLPSAGEMRMCFRYDKHAEVLDVGDLLSRGVTGGQVFKMYINRPRSLDIFGIFGPDDQVGVAESVTSSEEGQICEGVENVKRLHVAGSGSLRGNMRYWKDAAVHKIELDAAGVFNLCWRPVKNSTAGVEFGAWVPGLTLEISGSFVGQAWHPSTAVRYEMLVYGHNLGPEHLLGVAPNCSGYDGVDNLFPVAKIMKNGSQAIYNVTVKVPGEYRACLAPDLEKLEGEITMHQLMFDNDAGRVAVRGPFLFQQTMTPVHVRFDIPVTGYDLEDLVINLALGGCKAPTIDFALPDYVISESSRMLQTQKSIEEEVPAWGIIPAGSGVTGVATSSISSKVSAPTRCAGRVSKLAL
jgi:sugar lactone lactonase YvrE